MLRNIVVAIIAWSMLSAELAAAQESTPPASEEADSTSAPEAPRLDFKPPLPSSLYIVPMGGVHTAVGDTERAPPPLGFVGFIFGADYPVGSSPLTLGIQLQLGFATEDPGVAMAYLMGAGRLAYHVPVGDRSAVVPWMSVGLGLAGYDVNTFGVNSQLGLDFMFTKSIGVGPFVDFTGLLPTDREDFGILDVVPFDGAFAINFGGRLVIRLPFGNRSR